MNSQIAKKRIGDVIKVDTITNSQADFMATHVEVKNIQITQSYEGKVEKIVTDMLDRNYRRDGDGGLFRIHDKDKDMRYVEIWCQLNWFLNEMG